MPQTANDIKSMLVSTYAKSFAARHIDPSQVDDRFDLFTGGIIDSLGIMEMIAMVEESIGRQIDFDEMEADDLTRIGPFCRFVASKAAEEQVA